MDGWMDEKVNGKRDGSMDYILSRISEHVYAYR